MAIPQPQPHRQPQRQPPATLFADPPPPHGTVAVSQALPGDLAFYRSDGSVIDRLVDHCSGGGGVVHVEIITVGSDAASGLPLSIGALAGGMTRHALSVSPHLVLVPSSATLSDTGRVRGLDWLEAQVGRPYSYWNILADFVGFVLPRALGSRTPFLVSPASYDCSSLATLFLIHALATWLPDALVDDPARVSPNQLAAVCGLCASPAR